MELQLIQNRIFKIRSHRVILDSHLAELYEVEWQFLKSQIVTSKTENRGGKQKLPFAFTEQGVAMLSSVLRSQKAIDVNIAIMRAFVLLRQHLADYNELKEEISKLEREMNRKFKDVNEALRYLLSPKSRIKEIGFKQKGRSA